MSGVVGVGGVGATKVINRRKKIQPLRARCTWAARRLAGEYAHDPRAYAGDGGHDPTFVDRSCGSRIPSQAMELDNTLAALATADEGGATEPQDAQELAPGALVGRYVLLGRVGAGNMGVVHAAYDPDLDRKVALKLIRSDAGATIGHHGRDAAAA
jgi:hypothetical protein